MTKTTYKAIVRHLVEEQAETYIVKKNGSRYSIDRVELENGKEFLSFDVYFKQEWQPYRLHGYIDEYGHAYFCFLEFECDYYETVEDIEKDNRKHRHELLHGEELKAFKFKK